MIVFIPVYLIPQFWFNALVFCNFNIFRTVQDETGYPIGDESEEQMKNNN